MDVSFAMRNHELPRIDVVLHETHVSREVRTQVRCGREPEVRPGVAGRGRDEMADATERAEQSRLALGADGFMHDTT